MRATNSKGYTFNFSDEELLECLICAYGYLDIATDRVLPISLTYKQEVLLNKLHQLLKDDIAKEKRVIK